VEWVVFDPAHLPPEQQKMVVQFKVGELKGAMAFGMNIDGVFCEYHPDIDRYVEQEGLWSHVLRYVIIVE